MKLKLISDGTNAGTKLIDEDTGQMIHGIAKLTWEADCKDLSVTKTTVEFFNVPVEIISPVKVDLLEYNSDYTELCVSKSFDKNIKVTSESRGAIVPTSSVKIQDTDTNDAVGAVQSVKWEATPTERKAEAIRIRFDNKDW
jgi:hypothetical protein